ncbi:MAG: hypothetical protein PHV33_05945 [Elusimicrobiales bacterium]|nr:hypothetical protein [Elusimicrobiales bacterium]
MIPAPVMWLFYSALLASAAGLAWLLAADALEWLRASGRGRAAAALLLLAAAFAAAQFAFSGLPPRGGYDNDHDFQYAGARFFSPPAVPLAFAGKEVSPLLLGGLGDLLSGSSLAAVPVWNRLLLFAAAVLFFAFLRRCGLGAPAAAFGFAAFYFNFLSGLNGAAFTTTAANLVFACAALYAAACADGGRRGAAGLAAALCALFLVWAGRYELAAPPALLLAASAVRPGGGVRALLAGRRAAALAQAAAAAALCAAWYWLVVARTAYNGPAAARLLDAGGNFLYQFWDRNLGLLLPLPRAAAWALAGGAALLALVRPLLARDEAAAWRAGALLCACGIFSAVYMPIDLYPLHFMRHQLYFFLPFACLGALAWRSAWGDRARRLQWAALAVFCALYLRANSAAAASFNGETRTNDREWAVLLKAAGAWPEGCALAYGQYDHRREVLKKYFPLLSGDDGRPAPACVYKYISPHCQVFSGPEAGRPRDCVPPWLPARGGKVLAEASFPHAFYTIFDGLERRDPAPVTLGFYRADGPADRALLLRSEGLRALRGGDYAGAERNFSAALALAPACGLCSADLAASLALRRAAGTAASLRAARAAPDPAGEPLLSALEDAAAGSDAAALAKLREVSFSAEAGRRRESANAWRIALEGRSR